MKMVKNQYDVSIDFDAAVQFMDDDVREKVHAEIAPCSEQEFFDAYCVKHKNAFGEEFFLNEENPVW